MSLSDAILSWQAPFYILNLPHMLLVSIAPDQFGIVKEMYQSNIHEKLDN